MIIKKVVKRNQLILSLTFILIFLHNMGIVQGVNSFSELEKQKLTQSDIDQIMKGLSSLTVNKDSDRFKEFKQTLETRLGDCNINKKKKILVFVPNDRGFIIYNIILDYYKKWEWRNLHSINTNKTLKIFQDNVTNSGEKFLNKNLFSIMSKMSKIELIVDEDDKWNIKLSFDQISVKNDMEHFSMKKQDQALDLDTFNSIINDSPTYIRCFLSKEEEIIENKIIELRKEQEKLLIEKYIEEEQALEFCRFQMSCIRQKSIYEYDLKVVKRSGTSDDDYLYQCRLPELDNEKERYDNKIKEINLCSKRTLDELKSKEEKMKESSKYIVNLEDEKKKVKEEYIKKQKKWPDLKQTIEGKNYHERYKLWEQIYNILIGENDDIVTEWKELKNRIKVENCINLPLKKSLIEALDKQYNKRKLETKTYLPSIFSGDNPLIFLAKDVNNKNQFGLANLKIVDEKIGIDLEEGTKCFHVDMLKSYATPHNSFITSGNKIDQKLNINEINELFKELFGEKQKINTRIDIISKKEDGKSKYDIKLSLFDNYKNIPPLCIINMQNNSKNSMDIILKDLVHLYLPIDYDYAQYDEHTKQESPIPIKEPYLKPKDLRNEYDKLLQREKDKKSALREKRIYELHDKMRADARALTKNQEKKYLAEKNEWLKTQSTAYQNSLEERKSIIKNDSTGWLKTQFTVYENPLEERKEFIEETEKEGTETVQKETDVIDTIMPLNNPMGTQDPKDLGEKSNGQIWYIVLPFIGFLGLLGFLYKKKKGQIKDEKKVEDERNLMEA